MIPMAVHEVFHLVRAQEAKEDGREYAISMSYLEIYNKKVCVCVWEREKMCLPQYKPVEDYDCVELPRMSIPDIWSVTSFVVIFIFCHLCSV